LARITQYFALLVNDQRDLTTVGVHAAIGQSLHINGGYLGPEFLATFYCV